MWNLSRIREIGGMNKRWSGGVAGASPGCEKSSRREAKQAGATAAQRRVVPEWVFRDWEAEDLAADGPSPRGFCISVHSKDR